MLAIVRKASGTRPHVAVAVLQIACLLSALTANAANPPATDWQSRVSPELLRVYRNAANKHATGLSANSEAPSQTSTRSDSQGRVQVDVQFDCSVTPPVRGLTAAGLTVTATVKMPPTCVVEGWVAPQSLPQLTAVAGVVHLKVPVYASQRPRKAAPAQKNSVMPQVAPRPANGTTPSAIGGAAVPQGVSGPVIDGNGITISRADQYITQTTVNGAGVTVGVISDDVTSLSVIQSRGELPNVTVVPSSAPATPTDEGTVMLEEVHAMAPGASLAFCGPQTETEYLSCLSGLKAAGATILVDDLAFHDDDLMAASSQFQQSIQNFLAGYPAVLLFTVTDNYNRSYWEGGYSPVSIASLGIGYAALTCTTGTGTQTDYYVGSSEQLTVNVGGTYPVSFQWADPFGANVSNFDLYWVNTLTNATGCASAAGSPNTFFGPLATLTAGTYDVIIATPDQSLAAKFMKLFVGGNGNTAMSPFTSGSVVTAQAFVPGVVSVGAVNGSDGIGNTIEPYSGIGPIKLAFPTPTTLQAPGLVSTDNVYVDAAGTHFQSETTPLGNFVGTSAAAPNAAAVAALIRSAFPTLTPAQLTGYLQAGATQLGNTVPDYTFGYGRVDALGALNQIAAPFINGLTGQTIVGGTSSSPMTLDSGGVGNVHYRVTSSNPALFPATLVSAGTPGVTISPATCGTPPSLCTISFTPTIGQVGTTNIAVYVTDGANRSASTATTVTVTKPAAPFVQITGNPSQTITQGSVAGGITFVLTGTGPMTVSVTSSNATLLPNSAITLTGAGCGPTVNSSACVANLAPAAGQSGMASIMIAATDSYGQTSSAGASLQVNAPPAPPPSSGGHGGGGALDVWMLLGLGGLIVRSLGVRPLRSLQQGFGHAS